MTLRHLRTFITVCDCGSVTRAAEEMHIAQPAVSRTIAEMEEYYSLPLFKRIGRQLIPTDIGKELLLKAREADAAFTEFENSALMLKGKKTLKIGATLTIGKLYIPALLTAIKRELPEICTQVTVCRAFDIEQMLLGGEIDFALSESQNFSQKIEKKAFAEDKLVAVCGAEYPIEEEITVRELSGRELLLREKGSASREMIDGVFAIAGISAQPVMQSASNQALIAVAEDNHGIAVLPQKLVQSQVKSGKLKIVNIKDADLRRKYCVIYNKSKKFTEEQTRALALCEKANW